jgi:catechol 2,3-dioxygenase-like lactoylglutathione lyase family enzyme
LARTNEVKEISAQAERLPPAARATELEAGVVCRDLESMQRFCAEVLGFETVQVLQFDETGRIVKMRRGSARIKLFRPAEAIAPPDGDGPWFALGGWRYVALCVPEKGDVARLAAAVVDAGGRILTGPVDHRPGASAALVTDPEGNAWELLWESAEVDAGTGGVGRLLPASLAIFSKKSIIYNLVKLIRWLQSRAKEDHRAWSEGTRAGARRARCARPVGGRLPRPGRLQQQRKQQHQRGQHQHRR